MSGTWAPTYDSRLLNIGNVTHYSLQGAFLDIPTGSFHSLRTIHGPSVSESDYLLINNRRRSTGGCLMREDGKRPLIIKRRGVLEEKACPVGFRVEVSHLLYIKIPILSHTQHQYHIKYKGLYDCKSKENWPGYYCVSGTKRIIECPDITDLPSCDLGKDQPCHPHRLDYGCQNGLLAGHDKCLQKCGPDLIFPESPTYGTCSTPGSIMKPPPC